MKEVHTAPRSETRTLTGDIRNLVERHPTAAKTLGAIGLAGTLVFGVTQLGSLGAEARAGSTHEGERNSNITSIQLDNGANIRSDAGVEDGDFSNHLDSLDLGDGRYITVDTPDGVYTEIDNNGVWYGISADDLTDAANVHLDDDRDGIVWVNEQMATPLSEQPEN